MTDPEGLPQRRILVTAQIHEAVTDRLRKAGEIIINPGIDPWTPEEVEAHARACDAVMAFMPDRFDAAFFASPGRLKMLACALKGYDNFDIAAAVKAGVRVSIVPDLLTEPTAELAIGLAIGLTRHVRMGDARVRSGAFAGWQPVLYGTGLHQATVAVVGLGKVGRAIVDRLAGFGCARILGVDPRERDPRVEMVSLQAAGADADYFFLAAPLNAATREMIGRHYLSQAKPGQFIVNVGRGSVVDETAIAGALSSGAIGGYAADVFAFEDWALEGRPKHIPQALREHPATLFTPHLGSAVASVRLAIEHRAADNILAFLAGRAPPDEIWD
jgi:phosphonate dehydrogenase